MAINSTASAVTLQGNGATAAWPFAFKIPGVSGTDQTFVIVTLVDTTVTPASVRVLANNEYTISGVNTAGGGFVNYAPGGVDLVAGQYLTIQRAVTAVQSTQIPNQSAFLPAVVEAALDYLTMLSQQILTAQSRSIQAAISDSGGVPAALPDAAIRKNTVAVWDANGNLGAGAQANVIVNAAMYGLVQAASVAAARSFLGSGAVGDALFVSATKAAALTALGILSDPQTFAGALTLTAAPLLKSTTAGAGVEEFLTLLRNKGAGAANDAGEALAFAMMNSATAQKTFARVFLEITVATAAAEQGRLHFQTMVGGVMADRLFLENGLYMPGTTGDKGAGSINALGVYDNGVRVLPVLLKAEYAPGDAAFASGNTNTYTHGFGIVPKIIKLYLVNVTTDGGYTAGQVLEITPPGIAGASIRAVNVMLDATNIIVGWGNDATPYTLLNAARTSLFAITPANWLLRVRAYA